jgi:hypothetical protein
MILQRESVFSWLAKKVSLAVILDSITSLLANPKRNRSVHKRKSSFEYIVCFLRKGKIIAVQNEIMPTLMGRRRSGNCNDKRIPDTNGTEILKKGMFLNTDMDNQKKSRLTFLLNGI